MSQKPRNQYGPTPDPYIRQIDRHADILEKLVEQGIRQDTLITALKERNELIEKANEKKFEEQDERIDDHEKDLKELKKKAIIQALKDNIGNWILAALAGAIIVGVVGFLLAKIFAHF